jgi:hypothetical protein
MKREQPYWPLVLCLAFLKFIIPLISQHPLYELQRDEYLYYQQGLHPAPGYLENPPLLSWLGMISSWLGGSESWIKFWPCLFGAATVIITCLIAAELGGKLFAQFLAAVGVSTGAFVRVHYLFQPNFLDIFFWTLAIYFLIRYIHSKEQRFIYWLALSLALGWWSKYSVLFMALGIVIGLMASPYRNIFTTKKTWLAAGLALLIILPNLLWQYAHNWPLLHHMEELRDTQLKYVNKIDFIKDQFMMLMPAAVLWCAGLVWVLRQKSLRILGIIYFSVILLLLFGSGKAYYALGLYPMLVAAGAVAWEQFLVKRVWIRYALAGIILFLNWLIMPLLLPIWKPEKLEAFYKKVGIGHTWEDLKAHPLPQDFADMLGWKELTEKTEKFFHSLPDSTKVNTIIHCANYGQAGALKFYGKDDQFKGRVISENGSFQLWINERINFKHLIIIDDELPDPDDEVIRYFKKVTAIDSVKNSYSRQLGDKIFLLENLDSTGLSIAREGFKENKKRFNR